MIQDKTLALGDVLFELRGSNGELKQVHEEHNLVVGDGRAFIVSRMLGNSPTVISHMGIGSGNTAASLGQTGLVTEMDRNALTSASAVTTDTANDSAQYVAIFGPGEGTGAIVEAALFNNATGGNMLSRVVFAVINKAADDSLTITWKIRIAS